MIKCVLSEPEPLFTMTTIRKYIFYIQYAFHTIRYIKIRKILNVIIVLSSYLISRKKVLFSSRMEPVFISVEPYNYCQLSCPECPVSQRKKTDIRHISENHFYKAVNELKDSLFHIIFYFQGEPLINKNLATMINYAHKSGIFTSTSTNAQLLTEEKAKELIQSGLDKLIISIDGTTQKVYEQYRVGGELNKALNGVRNMVKLKHHLKSLTPMIEIQFVVFKTNEHQLSEMKKMAAELGADRLVFKTAQLYNFEKGHKLLTSIDKYARYKKISDQQYVIKSKLKNKCFRLWTGSVLNSNGEILPCCFDKNSEYAYGTIDEHSFKTNWQNKKASGFRASILQNRKQYEMCRNCTSK